MSKKQEKPRGVWQGSAQTDAGPGTNPTGGSGTCANAIPVPE